MIDPYHINFSYGERKRDKAKKQDVKKEPSSSTSLSAAGPSSPLAPTISSGSTSASADSRSTQASDPVTLTRSRSAHRSETVLSDLEYFKQNAALSPELQPRTTDFFSRRRPSATTSSTATPKPNASFPVVFPETEGLASEALPVRLGLAPPVLSSSAPPKPLAEYKARVGHGYYFCLPPPVDHDKRPNLPLTAGSQSSLHSTATPALVPDSPASFASEWHQGSSSDTVFSSRSFFPAGQRQRTDSITNTATSSASRSASISMSASSAGQPKPGQQSSCWDPSSYFVTFSTRYRGKVRQFKHHGFPSSLVPYWYGYGQDCLDAELDAHLASLLSLKGHTLTPLKAHPSRVLDLGCGIGAWCIDAARDWPSTEFIGLDVCPIQTPVSNLNNPDLSKRISWVVANFLETLPFPDNSFDYVHMRFLQQAIPESAWPEVITEVERVLAPGGKLEIVESNHIFYGHPSLVDGEELHNLESGKVSAGSSRPKLPTSLKVLKDWSEGPEFDPVQIVIERMMHRRFINPHPLSIIPSSLLTQGLTDVANGNPRHVPVYAESSRQRALARARHASGNSTATTGTSSDDDEKWKGKFTSRTQVGKPLNSSFHVADMDIFRVLSLSHVCNRFSSSRELIWIEAEEEKKELLKKSRAAPRKSIDSTHADQAKTLSIGHPSSLEPFAHPWESKAEFFQAMDDWLARTLGRRDVDALIDRYLGWDDGNEELTVQGRKQAERQRKMSNATAIPGLNIDTLANMPEVEETTQDEPGDTKATMEDSDSGRTSPLGFSIATSAPSHEAPGRLQSTPSSATTGQGDDKATDEVSGTATSKSTKSRGNKKDSPGKPSSSRKRPTSSGGVGVSRGAPGPSARARGFAPAGFTNLAVPDAPAFLGSFAMTYSPRDPQMMFAGPLQKANVRSGRMELKSGRSSTASSISTGKSDRTIEDDRKSTSGSTHSGGRLVKVSSAESKSSQQQQTGTAGDEAEVRAAKAAAEADEKSKEEAEKKRLAKAKMHKVPNVPMVSLSDAALLVTVGYGVNAPKKETTARRTVSAPPPPSAALPDIPTEPVPSNPVPATATAPASNTTPIAAATRAPDQVAAPGPKVKIVEPPSIELGGAAKAAATAEYVPRERKTRQPVALLGFYDVTGFVATAV